MRAQTIKKKREINTRQAARQSLLSRRAELLNQARANSRALTALEKVADDDQARILHDQFVSLHIGRLAYEQLKRIDAALARLDAGEYGICVDCESPISSKRLAAIPWADRCISCQERVGPQPGPDEFSGKAA